MVMRGRPLRATPADSTLLNLESE